MLVDFKTIRHDSYGKIEQPVLTLKTPDGRVISTVSNYFGLKTTFRFNDVSEISFSVPAFYEGEPNNGYDEIHGSRIVEVEPFGDFILVNPETKNEGGKKEVKNCKLYSLEYGFNYKRAEIPAGTYNFYNPVNNEDTIMQMIVEFMPDWSIGEIDRELIGRWRTFENVDENLYSFMMNTLQESYNCLFLFDTFNKKINVISAKNKASHLPIYLSYNNLIKSVQITELSDDIVTALSGYGSGDEVSIAAVNPNGTNTIYNLDYYISEGDLPDKLADKWTSYKDSLELYRQVFSNLNVLYLNKVNERVVAKAKLSVLQTEYDSLNTTYLTVSAENGQNPEYDEEIQSLADELEKKKAEYESQQAHVDMLDADIEAVDKQIRDVVSICSINSYFTSDEVKILNPYFKQDSLVEDTFVIPEYSSAILEISSCRLEEENLGNVKIVGAETYASNIAEIFATDEFGVYQPFVTDEESGEQVYNSTDLSIFDNVDLPVDIAETVADQLNDEIKKKVYEFRGGIFEFSQVINTVEGDEAIRKKISLSGDIVNVNLHYNVDNLPTYVDESSADATKLGFFILSATLRNATYDGTFFPNMNVTMQGMFLKEVPQVGAEFIGFDIGNAILYVTASNTEQQKLAIIQELYDYTKESLDKLAFPSYEFSVESGNFVFAEKFEPFKDQLKLGSTIYLALDDDEDKIIQPILIEISLNYDDETDFEITFSNKYRSSSSEFQLADIITEVSRQTHSTNLNKGDYSAYKDSKSGTQVDKLTNSAIDVVRNKIINSNNQSIEWNSSGMFFRKKLPNNSFDDHQIGIINENIGFTKDNWKTIDIAIGAYEDPNLGMGYGIIAPAIFGTLIAGENLMIENKVENETGDIVKQFIVDSTGAWLHNSSLAFTQEPNPDTGYSGGKILIDPRYGIAAGNINLFTLNGTDVVPTFWDTENNKIIWDESKVVETPDGSIYYVPNNSQFFFDINTGNAYFAGTISGENIVVNTINGQAIQNGTVDAGTKLVGDISPEQMKQFVLEAINQYATIASSDDKISLNLIGGLTNINFEGGTITADNVDAKNISGDLIQAINASIGTISADKVDVSGLISAGELVIEGENGKLAITPDYGIAAGNASLFTTDEGGNIIPSFIGGDGNLIIDPDSGAPLNSSFYFDIKTGRAYFTGPLSASQITTGKLSSDYINVKDGYITNAMIESLSAGKINTGTITADFSNAIISHVGAAQIHSAMISELEFGKITGIDINTSNLTIHSEDGKSQWKDNTIQISDANRIRVQIGKDAKDDYNMYVWDASGNLMFDALGLTDSGIQREIIRNDMVAQDAAIAGSKLNIQSVVEAIDGSEYTMSSSHLVYNGESLDVFFGNISNTIEEHGQTLSSQGTQISTIAGQITSKIWQQDIDTAKGEMSTEYSKLEQSLEGFKTEVSSTKTIAEQAQTDADAASLAAAAAQSAANALTDRVTTAETSITQNSERITQTASKLENLKIGGRNLLKHTKDFPISETVVGNDGVSLFNANGTLENTADGVKLTFAGVESLGMCVPLIYDGCIDNGETLTLSFKYRGNITSPGSLYLLQRTTPNVSYTLATHNTLIANETEWQEFKATFSMAEANARICYNLLLFYGLSEYTADNWIEVKDASLKLEKGNNATDWSPATEDLQSDIDRIESEDLNAIRESISSINQTAESISASVSSINTWQSDVDNLMTDIEKITGVLIEDGKVTFDFATIKKDVAKNSEELDRRDRYVNIDEDEKFGATITIGDTQSGMVGRFSKTSLDFLIGTTVVASYANNGLTTKNITTENQIKFSGNWAIRPGTDGNLNDVWIGG